jgi:hypothetical protein
MFSFVKKIFKDSGAYRVYNPVYRVQRIFDENGIHKVMVSVIGTSRAPKPFNPEEILADDKFTCDFSPLDVRTLTYLGYCNMNDPLYKIVIEKKNDNNEIMYLVKEKGKKQPDILKEEEIRENPDIYNNFSSKDAAKISKTLEEKANHSDLDSLKQFKKLSK